MITQEQITYFVNMVDTMRMHQKKFFNGDKAAIKMVRAAEAKVDQFTETMKEGLGISRPKPTQENRLF